MRPQTTLARAVHTTGIGLHTGTPVELTIFPAPPDTGYVFRRADLNGFELSATPHHVAHVSYATTLMRKGVMVSTVEHLLSALHGCQVDNAIIELNSFEVPILDGSALPFVELIEAASVVELPAIRQTLRILRSVEIIDGARRIAIHPYQGFRIESTIDFPHPVIGRQTSALDLTPENYRREIAPARTFGFIHEAEALRKSGLVRGASLENAVVLDKEKVLNPEPLRFSDEFGRHKVLDIVGDLALLGMPIEGQIVAERSGHGLHSALMAKLIRETDAWEVTEADVDLPAILTANGFFREAVRA